MITMTRRLMFSAAHADWLANLSREENESLFGASASPEPHGHNFILDVSVDGEIDPKTGILVNIKDIDRIVKEKILHVLDRKFLNRQVCAFQERPVTVETLAEFIAAELAPHLPPVVTLSRLRLEETPLHWVEWSAKGKEKEARAPKESGTMRLTRVYEFAASHRLHSPHLSDEENQELFGKCNYENGHGHNYVVEVTVSGPVDARSGRVMNEEALDALVQKEVLDRYDHRHLNHDAPEFAGLIPSAEIITKVIWERLRDHIPPPARLQKVLLRETARNIFEYEGEGETAA